MQRLSALTLSLLFTLSLWGSPASASVHSRLVTARAMQIATKVAVCEEGGWGAVHNAHGPTYYGNIGWLDATWLMFRRHDFPRRMDYATPQEQAWALLRMLGYYRMSAPDQRGCTGGY